MVQASAIPIQVRERTITTLIALSLENVSDSQADPIATYNSSGCKTKTPVMPASFTVQNP